MKKHQPESPRATGSAWLIPVAVLLVAGLAVAVPYHSPTVDGTITGDGTDWDPLDLVVDDVADDNLARTANIRRLWCTWDRDNLYLGVSYQDYGASEALRVYVDLDAGAGPTSAAGLEQFAGNFSLADGSIDLVLGRPAADDFPGTAPTVWRVLDGEGAMQDVSASVSVAQAFNTGAKIETRFPFWLNAECALPWDVLYPDLDGGVPAHAVIRAVAVAAVGDAASNGIDSGPDNAGLDGGTGTVSLQNLHASVIDSDGDGQPDPADGRVAGSVVLPDDDGTAAVTVSARLLDFAGRDPGTALATATGAVGDRDWELGRLPTGRYELTFEAEGYFPTGIEAEVVAGQLTEIDPVPLPKATAIRGTIGFASGPGGAGTAVLRGSTGAEIDRREFGAGGGSYVFYVQTSGVYTIEIAAATYLDQQREIPVTAGTDVTGVDFLLERQTAVSGTVSFESGPGAAGTIYFLDSAGEPIGSRDFASTGGAFTFYVAQSGQYTLQASAPTYLRAEQTLDVVLGTDLTGLELVLPRAPEVSGTIGFEGPAVAGLLSLYDEASGALRDTLSFSAEGEAFSFFLEPGPFRIELEAPGYLPLGETFTVGTEPLALDVLRLTAVRATRLLLVDEDGAGIPEVRGTASKPADDLWFPVRVELQAVDDDGRLDRFDLAGNLAGFRLSARKMDDVSSPTGAPTFLGSESLTDTSDVVDFVDGHGEFWMTNTSVEVLRVYLAQPQKDPIAGRIIVAFLDPQPTTVVLTADRDTLVADNSEIAIVSAALYDAGGNPSRIADLPITFRITDNSSGEGQFDIATTTTNANGEASAELTARGAGTLNISATVAVGNRILEVRGGSLESEDETLRVVSVAGEAAGWNLVLPGTLSPFDRPLAVTAQLIDAFGNPVAGDGWSVDFGVEPSGFGTFDPVSAATDTSGRAATRFLPAERAGLVSFTASGSGFAATRADLQLGDLFLVTDPAWYDEPADHQTFEATDLTSLTLDNTLDELLIDIAFASSWSGLQLHVIFETAGDAEGAGSDPFTQPVNYGHALRPDFALTCKYSANDYGDFRAWRNGRWEWWSPEAEEYQAGSPSGQNVQNVWTTKGADGFSIRIPWNAFGGRPDSVRVEAYVTQDENEVKRSAFDSVPSDATLNLDFDPYDPAEGDWDVATTTVTLSQWSEPYAIKTDFPTPPVVTEAAVEPAEVTAGDGIVLTATVADAGDGIGDVLADLSAMGGGALTRMYDDGDAGHGDATADDGVYSLATIVPVDNAGGRQELIVRAYEASNLAAAADSVGLEVEAVLEPILLVEDEIGDDHGPNQPGVPGLYYTYPTNLVFVEGAFDIESLTIFETRQNVGGTQVDMIAFQVKMGDFPDPADPTTADWNPNFAELNIQKIDIVIDSGPGGATASLPNRLAMFQTWDAWDYAIVMDGWFKALVPSLGLNTTDSWRANALTTDSDIILRSDPELDTVTALVSKEALGSPTAEQIRSWDIAVLMSSHDFGGEEVLGGIRWVNANRSEWQFGGGNRDDSKNIDANLMDLLLIPGTGKEPGRTQEELLDYTAEEALEREAAGQTGVALEMTALVDSGPPVIDTGAGDSVVTEVYPLADAPLALALNISDDYLVSQAIFRYRSTGYEGEGWDREVTMGDLGDDLWVVDIMPSWLDSNLVYSPVDSTRYLEFEVWAQDGSVDQKESTSPVTTLQIWPTRTCRERGGTLETELELLQQDGSSLVVSELLRRDLVAAHFRTAWTGTPVGPDSLGGSALELVWDLCSTTHSAYGAPTVPPADPIGVFRDFYLTTSDSLGGVFTHSGRLGRPLEVSLHYPQLWAPAGKDENRIALYRYHPAANRWTLVGGHVAPRGNTVTANIDETGSYGLFYAGRLDYDAGEVISGITISPNPFSPNGDGLYDETTISFYLTETASVTVEIYNIDGIRKRVLQDTFEYAGDELDGGAPRRVDGLIWDGTDTSGEPVPYGIYIMRVIAKYGFTGNERYVRSNHSLAVIK